MTSIPILRLYNLMLIMNYVCQILQFQRKHCSMLIQIGESNLINTCGIVNCKQYIHQVITFCLYSHAFLCKLRTARYLLYVFAYLCLIPFIPPRVHLCVILLWQRDLCRKIFCLIPFSHFFHISLNLSCHLLCLLLKALHINLVSEDNFYFTNTTFLPYSKLGELQYINLSCHYFSSGSTGGKY